MTAFIPRRVDCTSTEMADAASALLRMAQMPDGDSTGIQGFVFLLLADGKGGFALLP